MAGFIDSHAHLGEEAFDDDREAVLHRAAAAGVEAIVVIGYDAGSSRRAVEVARSTIPGSGPRRNDGHLPHSGSAAGAGSDPAAGAGSDTAAGAALEAAGVPRLYATAGIAPHHVGVADPAALDSIRRTLAVPEIVAVGEIGLEYHYDLPKPAQRRLLARQLQWAAELGLPVVIHSREAEHDMLPMLSDYADSLPTARRAMADLASAAEHAGHSIAVARSSAGSGAGAGSGAPAGGNAGEPAPRPPGVLHCFTESAAMAERLVEIGFMVSFAGILTFKNAGDLRDAAARVPLERTLIETDSPYLAPVPHRGRRNEPAFLVEVARALAAIHGQDVHEVAEVTAANARRLFGLPAGSSGNMRGGKDSAGPP